MPIYEYACKSCGFHFEANQRMTEAPLQKCPKCEKEELERLVSQSSFALKGSGWYADGYGSKPDKAEKPETSEKTDKPDKSSDSAKADSKPAPQEAAKPKAEPTKPAKSSAGD